MLTCYFQRRPHRKMIQGSPRLERVQRIAPLTIKRHMLFDLSRSGRPPTKILDLLFDPMLCETTMRGEIKEEGLVPSLSWHQLLRRKRVCHSKHIDSEFARMGYRK